MEPLYNVYQALGIFPMQLVTMQLSLPLLFYSLCLNLYVLVTTIEYDYQDLNEEGEMKRMTTLESIISYSEHSSLYMVQVGVWLGSMSGCLGTASRQLPPLFRPPSCVYFAYFMLTLAIIYFSETLHGSFRVLPDFIYLQVGFSCFLFSGTMFRLQARFSRLNEQFANYLFRYKSNQNQIIYVAHGESGPGMTGLEKLVERHYQLCAELQLVKEAWELQVTLVLLFSTIQIVIILNVIVIRNILYSEELQQFFKQFLMLGLYMANLLIVILPCHYTTQEALRTSRILTEQHTSWNKHSLLKEINMALRKISYHQKEFSAFGLLDINITLLQSIFENTIMYWTIVAQFPRALLTQE